jgi:hypothetical protein
MLRKTAQEWPIRPDCRRPEGTTITMTQSPSIASPMNSNIKASTAKSPYQY